MMFFVAFGLSAAMGIRDRIADRGRLFGAPCIRLGLRCMEFGKPQEDAR